MLGFVVGLLCWPCRTDNASNWSRLLSCLRVRMLCRLVSIILWCCRISMFVLCLLFSEHMSFSKSIPVTHLHIPMQTILFPFLNIYLAHPYLFKLGQLYPKIMLINHPYLIFPYLIYEHIKSYPCLRLGENNNESWLLLMIIEMLF